MSDFMKSIVAEVLERNHSAPPAAVSVSAPVPVPAPAGHSCSAGSQADCPESCASPGNCPKPPGGIKRINYQKEQAGKRLALLGLPGSSNAAAQLSGSASNPQAVIRSLEQPAGEVVSLPAPPDTVQGNPQSFAERCLSPLLLRTLPAGDSRPQPSGPTVAQHKNTNPPGDLLRRYSSSQEAGHTRIQDSPEILSDRNTASPDSPVSLIRDGNLDAWLFPVISSRLRPLLGTAGRNCVSAGVVSAAVSHPGQLFAAEELLAGEPALEADISWNNSGSGFELKLFSNDSGKLVRLLTELAGTIQRAAARRIQIYSSLQPGPLLRRHLAAGQQDAVVVIDASSRWNSIALAETLLGDYPDAGLSLRAERSYCIISGTSAQLAGILPGLTRTADK